MKIAVFSTKPYDKRALSAAAEKTSLQFEFFEHRLTKSTVLNAEGCDAVCLFVNDEVDEEVVRKLAQAGVKTIALRCAGYNNIDLDAAKSHGITIIRVPAYSPHAVAEHATALILTLNRKTHRAFNRVREGNFELNGLLGFDLQGKTVGVVGTGEIGKAFCQIMKGFGCRVIASDPQPDLDFAASAGVEYAEWAELLANSDVISLHCPLTPETRHLIDQNALSSMKSGCMLINTGRGALVDSRAVIEALKSGNLGHLGLDVYEEESELFFQDHSADIIQDDIILRLMSFPNVLVTGHQGFFTQEAMSAISETTVNNLAAIGRGESPEHACVVT
ncbi:MAG: 2-hydroxyacid dehydrogenase [Verrucomicrobiota bacterium]